MPSKSNFFNSFHKNDRTRLTDLDTTTTSRQNVFLSTRSRNSIKKSKFSNNLKTSKTQNDASRSLKSNKTQSDKAPKTQIDFSNAPEARLNQPQQYEATIN